MNVKWIYPGDQEYETERMNWDTRFNVYPEVIAQALNKEGVKEILKYIKVNDKPFAIRGGRHCFEPWSLSSGVVLDMSQINHVNIHKKTAKIGSGARLGDIYKSLLDKGYFIPAGTRPTVGIGGQGVNGGIGYSTRKYGLLIDKIVKFKVITADGEYLTVSQHKNSDLFWALKGSGAGNFCVVVEYHVNLIKARNVTVFTFHYSFEEGCETLRWLTEINNSADLTCQAVINSKEILLTGQYFGKPRNSFFKELRGLPEPKSKEILYVSYSEAVKYWSAPTPKESVKSKSRFFRSALGRSTIFDLVEFVKNTEVPEGARLTIGFQQIKNKTFSGCIPWKKATYWINWTFRWSGQDPEIDLELLEKSYIKTIKDHAATPYSYSGMMDLEAGDFPYTYYGKNYDKLLKIKRKYDPKSLFRY